MQHRDLPDFDEETLEAINDLRQELNSKYAKQQEAMLQQMRDHETASKLYDDEEYGLTPDHVTRNDAIVAAEAEAFNPIPARDETWLNPPPYSKPKPEFTIDAAPKAGKRKRTLRDIFEGEE